MVKEIYIRDESDPFYEPGVIEYSDEMESVISQVKMILGTKKGNVLGDYNFGIDIERMVFNTRKSGDEIIKELNEQINQYVYHGDNVSVECRISFGNSGEGYDYAVIDIYINGTKTVGFLVDKE